MGQLQEVAIAPPPGVVKSDSLRVTEGRWSDTINMRFVKTKPQKIGGWTLAYTEQTNGTPRTLHAWRDTFFNAYLGVGTYIKLYIYDPNRAQNDITPYRDTGTLGSNPITVTDGSSIVTISDTAHGLNVGDIVYFSGATAVGGITLSGAYTVTSIIDANTYTIIAGTVAVVGNDSFTKVLLHFDGTDAATTFTDSNTGGSAKTWTAIGNAQIDTAAFKFSTASGLFDGTGDGISTPDHADFTLGSGNFTVDCWFNCTSLGGVSRNLFGQNAGGGTTTISLRGYLESSTGKITVVAASGSSTFQVTGTSAFSNVLNTGWHHFAMVRSSATLSLYIDGILEGSTSIGTSSVNDSAAVFVVGAETSGGSSSWMGWIDEFRLSVGTARWTANFTPPAIAYSSVTTGGGAAVAYKYEIPIGVELGTYGFGYGVGGYGLELFDDARTESTIVIEPRIWSLDHFGVYLLAAYNGGTIYYFNPTASPPPWTGLRATKVSSDPGLPTTVRAMFVTPERFVMALCEGMQVAWPSQGTIDVWTPSATNTANIRTLTEGTKLVAGKVLADFVSLVWTDAALYRFQYTGATYVYASSMVAKDCGLVSPNAAVTIGGVAYWLGQDNFWTYNGTVSPMSNVNDIRKWVFDDLDVNLGYQCNASYNPVYNEIWFFISDEGHQNPNRGLIYSIDEQCWAPLYWGRAGGTHFTQGDTRPIFGGNDGYLYLHENGHDDNGAILPYSMTLAPYSITKGGQFNMHIEYIVPDFFEQTGEVTLTIEGWDRLNDSAETESETEIVGAVDTGVIDTRLNGRYIGITAAASSLGSYIRLGQPVAFIRASGRRV